MEHVHRLPGQCEVGPALSLVLRQRPRPRLLLLLRHRPPPLPVRHLLLDLVDALQGVHALVEEEGGVVHQHVDELDELLSGLGLVDDGDLVDGRVPHGLDDDGDVVADGELVVELRGGPGLLNICSIGKSE